MSLTTQPRTRHVAAFLDAVFPGLGHVLTGRRRRAILFAAPIVALVLAGTAVLLFTPSIRLITMALDPAAVAAFFAIQALILIWRVIAVASSLLNPRLPRLGRHDALPITVIAIVLIVPQAYAGYVTNVAREVTDEIIPAVPETAGAWQPPMYPGGPGGRDFDFPSSSPSAPAVPRENLLVIGVDQGVGRNTFLTDTMIVVSLDPVGETVSMVSIPRDMVDVPLPDGRTFRGKINGLLSYARHHPKEFPGSDGSGHDVLMGALGTLLGLKIDYFAQVNLAGFVSVVNALGGINVDVADGFCDPTYHEYGYPNGFSIKAGRHHLNGNQALAFARVRKAAGESDFTRAARQQEVLSGIRDAVKSGGFLGDPVAFMKAMGKTVVTNIPRKRVPDIADAAIRIGRTSTYRAVIKYPLVRSGSDSRGSIQIPDLEKIRAFAADFFSEPGTAPPAKSKVAKASGKVAGSGVSNCQAAGTPKPKTTPKPTPKATPRPTPKATPKPTVVPTPTPSPTEPPDSSPVPSEAASPGSG